RAVVILIRRVVSDEILGAQFPRNLIERSFEREHVAGEERLATGLLRECLQIAICLVGDLTCFDAGYGSQEAGLGRDCKNRRFGALSDIDGVADICATVSVFT